MLAHCNLEQNMCLCSKQSSLFSFYAMPSGDKSKDEVVHWLMLKHTIVFIIPIPTLLGSPVRMNLHLSQQHAGLQYRVLRPQREVSRPKARFRHSLPKKSEVDGGETIRCQHVFVSCFTCTSHGDLVLSIVASVEEMKHLKDIVSKKIALTKI